MKVAYEKIQKTHEDFIKKNGYQPAKIIISRKYAENNFDPVPVTLLGMDVEIREPTDMEDHHTFYLKGYKKAS